MMLNCAAVARAALGVPARERGKQLFYLCPQHGDQNPSLQINTEKNCWMCGPCGENAQGNAWKLAAFLAGRDPGDKEGVATWLRERNLLAESARRRVVKTYPYHDERGQVLFETVRYEPKGFGYRQPGLNGTWIPSLDGVRRVLYNLPAVLSAQDVWIVEGEKDADNLMAWGLVATTNPMGAGKWKPEYNRWLRDKVANIISDNDKAGEKHAEDIARQLATVACEVRIVFLPGLPPKGDFSDWKDAGGRKEELLKLRDTACLVTVEQDKARGEVRTIPINDALPSDGAPWPDALSVDALYGLAGEWCRIVEPHSEADLPAHLIQFLLGFGNAIGRSAHYRVAATKHCSNLFALLVGATGKSRKGTSWGQDRFILSLLDREWSDQREMSGLSTGEGLIYFVRDPRPAGASPSRKRRKSNTTEEADLGVSDKRLLVVESEFARVLKVSERESSTLSAIIRDAWDGRPLSVMVKRDALQASGAHISILGHITTHELRRRLTEESISNGFANRFLFVCTRRVRSLPDGGELERVNLQPYISRLKKAYEFSRVAGELTRDAEAKELWHAVYRALSEGHPGLFGAVTARAEPHVLRLACLYALLDCSPVVRKEHLQAALGVWRYCENSARYIFGTATGDPVADDILAALRARHDTGMTRTELFDYFNRRKKAAVLDSALKRLLALGVVRPAQEATDGRPAERWFPV